MSLSLSGRVGMVLGVSSENSLGFQCAKDLLARGARVCISYRPKPGARGPELATLLGCESVALDAASEFSVAAAIGSAGQRWERLDFMLHTLVHVPEGALQEPLLNLSRTAFSQVMDTSVYSLIECARHALPWLRHSSAARLVTLLSPGADHVLPHYHAVGMSKAALAACLRYLAAELGPEGVLCNGVNFSILDTDAAERVIGEETTRRSVDYLAKRSLTRQALTAEDVCSAVAYLCSSECRNMTGEIVNIDGGYCHSYF